MAHRKYYMVLDTETCNGLLVDGKLDLSQSLVYDIGFVIVDKKGRIYDRASLTISEIFCEETALMRSAYYADKLPNYWQEIREGKRLVVSFMRARQIVRETMKAYNITTVSAHNARFDLNALNNTLRYITKSKYRYFFPYGTEIWCTLKGAQNTICKQKGYIRFCERNGYMTKHKKPRVRATAEILYRYLTNEKDFVEVHEGLEDCVIESKILVQVLRQHRKKEYIRLYA